MRTLPIAFSPAMANACWHGRKTETRRVLLPPKSARYAAGDRLWVRERWCVSRTADAKKPSEIPPRSMTTMFEAGGELSGITPYEGNRPASEYQWSPRSSLPDWAGRMRPAMFMMPWQSRMTLIVEEVRAERLQEITSEAALAEGVDHLDWELASYQASVDGNGDLLSSKEVRNYVPAYRRLWDKLNAARGYSWDSNPWVTVTRFSVRKVNFEALP